MAKIEPLRKHGRVRIDTRRSFFDFPILKLIFFRRERRVNLKSIWARGVSYPVAHPPRASVVRGRHRIVCAKRKQTPDSITDLGGIESLLFGDFRNSIANGEFPEWITDVVSTLQTHDNRFRAIVFRDKHKSGIPNVFARWRT